MPEAALPAHIERWLYENVDGADPLFADAGPGDDEATQDKETEQ